MIFHIKDGPLVVGIGRTLDEAVDQACHVNRQIGDMPTDPAEMKRLIDIGAYKVREVEEGGPNAVRARG